MIQVMDVTTLPVTARDITKGQDTGSDNASGTRWTMAEKPN